MSQDQLLVPAQAHPFPPCTPAQLARFLHVRTPAVLGWLDDDLPTTGDGLIDPFTAVNWLSWGRLSGCPVLQRRWNTYLAWFAPHLSGTDRAQRYVWRRIHRLYLPRRVAELMWYLPDPLASPSQEVGEQAAPAGQGLNTEQVAGGTVLRGNACERPVAEGWSQVRVHPQRQLSRQDADFSDLATLMVQVAGDFTYAYRHHLQGEYPLAISHGQVTPRWQGSCLDCALALGWRLSEQGRPWRLCGGVVAKSAIANPHFWLETQTSHGWVTLDPTLAAIVRMLGGDWKSYALAYTGACDARRVALRLDGQVPLVPGGTTLGGVAGEAVVSDQGQQWNAMPCSDWVCGECSHRFDRGS